jgi:hypothetical protein
VIQPLDGSTTPAAEATGEPAATQTTEPEQQGTDVSSVSTNIGGVGGSGSRLGLDAENNLVRADEPSAAPAAGPGGLTMSQVDTDAGQAVGVCDGSGDCADVSSASREGEPADDVPLGWLGDGLVYQRTSGNSVAYRYVEIDPDTGESASDTLLLEEDSALASVGTAYASGATMLVPTASGDWVVLTPDGGHVSPSQYGTPGLVRVSGEGYSAPFAYVSYVANGTLIIAHIESPGDAIAQLPFSGTDYDVSPDVTQVVVTTGHSLEIYSTSGDLLQSYDAGDVQIGGVLWLRDGIVYEDLRSGDIYQIEETVP